MSTFSLVFSYLSISDTSSFGRIVKSIRVRPSARDNVYTNVVETNAVLDIGRLTFSKGDFRVCVDRVQCSKYPIASLLDLARATRAFRLDKQCRCRTRNSCFYCFYKTYSFPVVGPLSMLCVRIAFPSVGQRYPDEWNAAETAYAGYKRASPKVA